HSFLSQKPVATDVLRYDDSGEIAPVTEHAVNDQASDIQASNTPNLDTASVDDETVLEDESDNLITNSAVVGNFNTASDSEDLL
ncbi:hypothetical protein, partial [Pseudomonas sp. HY2-MNA-CIBAN-0224]